MLDQLRRVPLFAGLSEEDLERLYQMAETVTVPAGQLVLQEGDPGDALYVVLDGELEITKRQGGQDILLAVSRAGEFLGEMSLLEQTPRAASVRTLRESRLLVITQTAFQTLLSCSPSVPLRILHTLISRLRNNESVLMHNEKMAALGTLANDPQQAKMIDTLQEETAKRTVMSIPSDPLSLSDQEDELQEWLEDRSVEQAWEIAPVLISFGWDRDELERVAEHFSPIQIPVVVQWLAASSSVYGLLEEVGTSAEAISEIVRAVKTYSYLDQAPIQEVDLKESLENTLVLLRPKIKPGISIVRDYADDVPRIEAYGSELNQVWTNIIDNAIDAARGQGELVLRTYAKDDDIIVEITDNGPGIPPEIQPRIFEPFFTTKAPGVGTGLGLHIAYNVVVHKHHGQIQVTSKPGETRFRVTLPNRLAKGDTAQT